MDVNAIKWAEANAEIGLKRDEICPGLTVDQHAESVAMFYRHNANLDNKKWALTVRVVAHKLAEAFMHPPLDKPTASE